VGPGNLKYELRALLKLSSEKIGHSDNICKGIIHGISSCRFHHSGKVDLQPMIVSTLEGFGPNLELFLRRSLNTTTGGYWSTNNNDLQGFVLVIKEERESFGKCLNRFSRPLSRYTPKT
jgi:hypothetical protein